MRIKKMVLAASFIATAAVASTTAFAQDKSPGSGPSPYTDCGIGAALFPNTGWAAVTSNVIWDVGTTAITSATNSPQTCSKKKTDVALFIRDTYQNLAEETAVGQGDHLITVLTMMDCSAAQQATAIQEIRSEMGRAVAVPSYMGQGQIEKASRFYNIAEGAANRTCSA